MHIVVFVQFNLIVCRTASVLFLNVKFVGVTGSQGVAGLPGGVGAAGTVGSPGVAGPQGPTGPTGQGGVPGIYTFPQLQCIVCFVTDYLLKIF